MRQFSRAALSLALSAWMAAGPATAQEGRAAGTTADPQRMRPLSYTDLRSERPEVATYREIWRDALRANGKAYEAKGDLRYVGDTAPATEAHYVVWTPTRSLVFTVLNTATGCTTHLDRPDIGIRVKLCPMRVAFYEGGRKTVTAGPAVCYLEWTNPALAKADAYRSVAYAAYDRATRTLQLNLTVDHKPLEDCGFAIPLAAEPVSSQP